MFFEKDFTGFIRTQTLSYLAVKNRVLTQSILRGVLNNYAIVIKILKVKCSIRRSGT